MKSSVKGRSNEDQLAVEPPKPPRLPTKEPTLKGVRGWLTENEIYFKAVTPAAALLLTLCSLVVAASSAFVSYQAMQIAAHSAEMTRMQALPNFVIREQSTTYEEVIGGRNSLVVHNEEGGAARETITSAYTFMKIEGDSKSPVAGYTMIPLIGYYNITLTRPSTTGELAIHTRLNDPGNWFKISGVILNFMKLSASNGDSGFASLRRYVDISYADRWGSRHSEMYEVTGYGATSQIGGSSRENILLLSSRVRHLNFEEIDEMILYQRWLEVRGQQENGRLRSP